MPIRSPTRAEITLLRRSFDHWGVFDYFEGLTIVLNQSGENRIVCASTKALEAIALPGQTTHYGLEVGQLRKKFVPSVAGADLFVRAGCNKRLCVSIGEVGQELVLYGRDVMGESVIQASEELVENEIVILTGTGGQVIGVGRTRVDGRRLSEHGMATISTLRDAGVYLREEGN